MYRLIIFLVRKRLRLKVGEPFRFTNQRSKLDYYYFTKKRLVKAEYQKGQDKPFKRTSNVSFNWLIDKDCKIRRCDNGKV